MYGRTITPDVPTTERFIDLIMSRVACDAHPHGTQREPCYTLPISITKDAHRSENWGICNARARKAGFVGVAEDPKPKKFHSQWNRS